MINGNNNKKTIFSYSLIFSIINLSKVQFACLEELYFFEMFIYLKNENENKTEKKEKVNERRIKAHLFLNPF